MSTYYNAKTKEQCRIKLILTEDEIEQVTVIIIGFKHLVQCWSSLLKTKTNMNSNYISFLFQILA